MLLRQGLVTPPQFLSIDQPDWGVLSANQGEKNEFILRVGGGVNLYLAWCERIIMIKVRMKWIIVCKPKPRRVQHPFHGRTRCEPVRRPGKPGVHQTAMSMVIAGSDNLGKSIPLKYKSTGGKKKKEG